LEKENKKIIPSPKPGILSDWLNAKGYKPKIVSLLGAKCCQNYISILKTIKSYSHKEHGCGSHNRVISKKV
jgi:hypothetical protein